jgi:DNA polymerase III subunit delta
MSAIRPDAFRQQIARKATDPVVLIVGDDEHEKSALAVAVGDMIEEDLRAFNVERLYATDKAVTPASVVEGARTLPMLASRRVVIVLAAEKLLVPRKKGAAAAEDDADAGDVEPLIEYFANPSPETTLILVCGAGDTPDAIPLPKNLRVTKALAARATIVTCSGLDGGKDPARWIQERAKSADLEIDRQAVARLLDLAGGDPGRLRADVDKLLLFAAGSGKVTLDHVRAVAGAPVHHGDDWALVRALEQQDAPTALRELQASLDEDVSPFLILGQIAGSVRSPRNRYSPRRIPAAIDAIFKTDQAMKSSGGDPKVLLERLIVEMCG